MKEKQRKRSRVLLVANLLMLFMLLGTAVYAFVWEKQIANTDMNITVSADEGTLTIITEDIGGQHIGSKLIPQTALATHKNEKKVLVYTVEIALKDDLEGSILENDLEKDDLEGAADPIEYLDVTVEIVKKVNNVWTATITVELNNNFNSPETFKNIEGEDYKININFTLKTIPDEE